jgi:hypothetical protein
MFKHLTYVAVFLSWANISKENAVFASSNSPIANKPNDWLTCDEFMEHAASISKSVGTKDPRQMAGYSPLICNKVFKTLSKSPKVVDGIVNLGAHFEAKRRRLEKVDFQEIVDNKASWLRSRKLDGDCEDFDFGFGNPGPSTREQASAIGSCEDLADDDTCPHSPCVPTYLQADLTDDVMDPFEEFIPGYGGTVLYTVATDEVSDIYDDKYGVWNGCPRDRTSADAVGELVVDLITESALLLALDLVCEAMPDDIDFGFAAAVVDFPNAGKVICVAAKAIAELVVLPLITLQERADFQDALVDGAEIEAAYEHTGNLLHKQCAIFDQAVCRCVEEPKTGQGCDGVDSNCNDLVDDCDEDQIPPEVFHENSLSKCSSGVWFADDSEAVSCVEETVVVQDDCHISTFNLVTSGSCDATIVTIQDARDDCGNTASAVDVPVQVDGEKPTASCSFNGETNYDITETGSGVLQDVAFSYDASDNCGLPLEVTVNVYCNEIEDFSAQELAVFFQNGNSDDRSELYLASAICSTTSNGQCIKDPVLTNARLYTAVVTAVDQAGLTASTECTVRVLPQGGNGDGTGEIEDSTQRFFLTSYSSEFSDYTIV